MSATSPKILFVTNFYPEFLAEVYRGKPQLSTQDYDHQLKTLMGTNFGVGDAYSYNINTVGGDAAEIICNADHAQEQWARENSLGSLCENIHDRRRQILEAQIRDYRPDVLYVFEWSPLGDNFLVEMKTHVPLIVGQVASTLPANRTYAGYDVMLSSWPPIVQYFRNRGMVSQHFKLGFDDRIPSLLGGIEKKYDVTFVGGFAPCHDSRVAWLEAILEEVPVDVFGYGIERVVPDSPIHAHHHGTVWGTRMYQVLAQSRITLHLQADIQAGEKTRSDYATAMRFYEATGVGACLVTPAQTNMADIFEPQKEVIGYQDIKSGIASIKHLLAHPDECRTIAQTAQARTLTEHTYHQRMVQLQEMLVDFLADPKCGRGLRAVPDSAHA